MQKFSTTGLIGRRVLANDVDFLVELHQSGNVMALHGGTRSPATTERFIGSNLAHWDRFRFGLYVISPRDEPDRPIGRAGLRWDRSVDGDPVVDVSAVLTEPSWGQGLGTEAVQAVTAIGLHLDLPLAARTDAAHKVARRVLEKVGYAQDSDFEHGGRAWVRYRWPSDRPSPGKTSRTTSPE